METRSKVTGCNDCPFHVPGGEYEGYCNHPTAPEDHQDVSIEYDLNIKCETLKTESTTYGHYHHETVATPEFCPLRYEVSIYVGNRCMLAMELDKQLFIENLKKD